MSLNKDSARCNSNMYVAWDTETTGLPGTRVPPTLTNLHKYDSCRIVSLAAVKYSSRGREVASFHRVVKPDGYAVGATEIHGITHEYATEHGTPFEQVFREFMEFVGPVQTLVAHNSAFDENVLASEVLRLGVVPDFAKFTFVCTNKMHKEFEFSSIKLIDLYTKIFGHGFDGAHDALNDARACGAVYPRLKEHDRRCKPIGVKKVCIKASDVSSILGLSQFKRAPDVVEELWRKHLPETCTMKSKAERAMEVINSCERLQQILELESVSGLDEVETIDSLTPAQKGLVKDYLRNIAMTRPASTSSTGEFHHYNVCSIEGTLYQIVGRVGPVRQNDDGTCTLVEMKQRTKGLFNRLRDYEEAQCRVYLAMMPPHVRDCLLVESYDGDKRSYLVQRDSDKWCSIAQRLRDFCLYFHHVVSTS